MASKRTTPARQLPATDVPAGELSSQELRGRLESIKIERQQLLEQAAALERQAETVDDYPTEQDLRHRAADLTGMARFLGRQIANLPARIDAARTREVRAAAIPLRVEHAELNARYRSQLFELARITQEMFEFDDRARLALGDVQAQLLCPAQHYIGLLRLDGVQAWLDRLERDANMWKAQQPGRRLWSVDERYLPSDPPRPQTEEPPTALRHAVRLEPHERAGPGALMVAPLPPPLRYDPPEDRTPLKQGHARVRTLRAGWDPAPAYGQVTQVPTAVAEKAASNGAVTILESWQDPTQVTGARWSGSREDLVVMADDPDRPKE